MKYKNKENISTRLLHQKYEKVLNAKELLLEKHLLYAEKSGKDLKSLELQEWITPKLDAATDLLDDVFVMHEDLDKLTKDEQFKIELADTEKNRLNELGIITMQLQSGEDLINHLLDSIIKIVDDDSKNTEDDAALVRAFLLEVDRVLDEQIKSWNKMKLLLIDDDTELKSLFIKENGIRSLIAEKRSIANAFVDKTNPSHIPIKTESSSITADIGSCSSMKLEKMKLPKFKGNCRTFAKFKADFQTIVAPAYSNETHLTFVLKENCLQGQAKALVENIDKIEEIWARLEARYGDDIEIVSMVIKDIEKLNIPRNDQDAGLVNLVDCLEKGLQDLGAINARTEIANAYTVKLIETKLPRRILSKWLDMKILLPEVKIDLIN